MFFLYAIEKRVKAEYIIAKCRHTTPYQPQPVINFAFEDLIDCTTRKGSLMECIRAVTMLYIINKTSTQSIRLRHYILQIDCILYNVPNTKSLVYQERINKLILLLRSI